MTGQGGPSFCIWRKFDSGTVVTAHFMKNIATTATMSPTAMIVTAPTMSTVGARSSLAKKSRMIRCI